MLISRIDLVAYVEIMSGTSYVRVAVVQLAYHPAVDLGSRSYVDCPTPDTKLLSFSSELLDRPELESGSNHLYERIRRHYCQQLFGRVTSILRACQAWQVHVVVFPEYAIPAELLKAVTAAAPTMVIVAGTHMVERRTLRENVYQELGWPEVPEPGMAVCPVLFGHRLIGLQPKLDPAAVELGSLRTGTDWRPIALPDGLPGPMGVLICKDFMHQTSDAHQEAQVDEKLRQCSFVAVTSLTPPHSVEEFASKAREHARRYGRPVLYTNNAPGGGTTIFSDSERKPDSSGIPHAADVLGPGDEGVVVADIDFAMTSAGRSTRYAQDEVIKPYAAASFVYQHTSAGREYAQWLRNVDGELARDEFQALEVVAAQIKTAQGLLRAAGDQHGAAIRKARLRRLRVDADRFKNMEENRRLLREVVMPPDVLPLPALQQALCSGAHVQLWTWTQAHREPSLATMASELKATADRLLAKLTMTEDAAKAMGDIVRAVGGQGESDQASSTTPVSHGVAHSVTATEPAPARHLPHVAHPYCLLKTSTGLVGRRDEIARLDQWLDKDRSGGQIFAVVALGGMGKSALTWHWFNEVARNRTAPSATLDGQFWWSFYEADANFDNFIDTALRYTTGMSHRELSSLHASERGDRLLQTLDAQRCLMVLDGFERVLRAYASPRATHVDHDRDASGSQPDSSLRRARDMRIDRFLQRLTRVRQSRVVLSTRLFPAILEGPGGLPVVGVERMDLDGLGDDDALALWRAFGASGQSDTLLAFFRTFDKHPLLIQALASCICRDRRTPRDYDAWRANHPDFDPFSLPMTQVKSHVLATALDQISDTTARVLQILAGFRMPVEYNTLIALAIGTDDGQCANEAELISTLQELEERGLVGWDNRPNVNRYDLHPIVRGVVWHRIARTERTRISAKLEEFFHAAPIPNRFEVQSLKELTPVLELYHLLIEQERYDDALSIFRDRLHHALQYRLSRTRDIIELLEHLFDNDLEPRVTAGYQPTLQRALAEALHRGGSPGRSVLAYRRELDSYGATAHHMLGDALLLSGQVRQAHQAAMVTLQRHKEQIDPWMTAVTLTTVGRIEASRGAFVAAEDAFRTSNQHFDNDHMRYRQGGNLVFWSQLELWRGRAQEALTLAERAWELAGQMSFERDFIRAGRMRGEALLALGSFTRAEEYLYQALARARTCDLVEEELPALLALARIRYQQGELDQAHEWLDEVWEQSENGPFPLYRTDAYNQLARLEHAVGNSQAALDAATCAREHARCDGAPFAYAWGLERAETMLTELATASSLFEL